ncbi:MAG: hypothetical protein CFK52_02570 [Chloracidobacterium sp. CP2_5A]|nr:MAG: hypothetical protein CFK52_02570 [Chloracidobacterium sp. CP2_5A]
MNLTIVTSALQPGDGQMPSDMAAAVAERLATLQHSKDQALRAKLRRAGWALMIGGPLLAATLGISASVLENISHWLSRFVASFSGFGGLMLFAGILLLLYARMAFKKEPPPQVVVVAVPPAGMTGQLPSGHAPVPPFEHPYRSTFPAPATVAEPASVTERTTELLNDPCRESPKAP